MRPFRDPLSARLAAALALAMIMMGAACRNAPTRSAETAAPPMKESLQAGYYPLGLGNSWTFRCSVEGQFRFEKTLSLTSETVTGDTRFFRAELTRSGDNTPFNYYLFRAADGTVFKAPGPNRESAEPLVGSDMKVGEKVGNFTAAAMEKTSTPATNELEAIRLENFSQADPNVAADKRLEWLGRSYAKGVGPLVEADGLGGECVLVRYKLAGK